MKANARSSGSVPAGLRIEKRSDGLLAGRFFAMGSPCEILVADDNRRRVHTLIQLAAEEAWRIEKKYSRYRDDSIITIINRNAGEAMDVDAETAKLLDFAAQCHELSDGLFDITSGALRRVWTFDGSDRIPSASAVNFILPLVGFDKIKWQAPQIMLPEGMELDLGGIGKEYAVDRVHELLAAQRSVPFLVNFGGDLRADRIAPTGAWQIGVERPGTDREAAMVLELEHGALATSGDARRFLLKDGVRYGHIIDPRTGWPVVDAPRSITVAASTCVEAGLLSTLAMLQGKNARQFLDEQQVRYWIID
ncbi:MAG TPA: FAD:protein FMN transferase [Steroidobacteraceae bacterium]|nr:FAD:protein FMN transferase [Steroidobacteraceae bacterium]